VKNNLTTNKNIISRVKKKTVTIELYHSTGINSHDSETIFFLKKNSLFFIINFASFSILKREKGSWSKKTKRESICSWIAVLRNTLCTYMTALFSSLLLSLYCCLNWLMLNVCAREGCSSPHANDRLLLLCSPKPIVSFLSKPS
jgi:hypothetical protein